MGQSLSGTKLDWPRLYKTTNVKTSDNNKHCDRSKSKSPTTKVAHPGIARVVPNFIISVTTKSAAVIKPKTNDVISKRTPTTSPKTEIALNPCTTSEINPIFDFPEMRLHLSIETVTW